MASDVRVGKKGEQARDNCLSSAVCEEQSERLPTTTKASALENANDAVQYKRVLLEMGGACENDT
jgi:hypothetical protein